MGKPGVFKKISSEDQTITPFKAYKSWRYTDTGSLVTDGLDRLVAIKPNYNLYSGKKVTLDSYQTNLDTGSYLINIANDQAASMIWYSINHLYYKRAGKPAETFGYQDHSKIERTLFDEASVISIPQKKFGEAIKPGSVKIRLQNSQLNNVSMSLYDDGKGNLIDSALSSSISNELLYLGFNNMTFESNYYDGTISTQDTNEINKVMAYTPVQNVSVTSKNVWITPSYNLPSESLSRQWGNSARMYSDGYIRIPNKPEWNFKLGDDYAISLWYYRESNNNGTILSKRRTSVGSFLRNNLLQTQDVNQRTSQYPFNVEVAGSTLTAKISNGSSTCAVSASITSDSRSHLLLQKSGSSFQLYINGTFANSSSIFTDGNCYNEADIFIGCSGLSSNGAVIDGFEGAIDEFFIFNKSLTQNEISQLSTSEMSTNTNVVGNVFYEHGIIVLSDPRSKYGTKQYRMFNDALYDKNTNTVQTSYLTEFYLEYNSTVTLYEHEYIIKIKEDEFNFTSNDTIRKENDPSSQIPKDFVFNDEFSPYITTIGLYTAAGELVAVGKLGTPIKKRDDVDLNIVVRFDV
jgi:hypothetical protein